MTQTEYDCLNSIRYGMKLYMRWAWDTDELLEPIWDAMSYIEDILWAELSRNPVKLGLTIRSS